MPAETAVDPEIRGRVRSRRRDEAIGALAGRQHGVGRNKLTVKGRWMAAVLAGGRAAALSHRSAAAWEILTPTRRD